MEIVIFAIMASAVIIGIIFKDKIDAWLDQLWEKFHPQEGEEEAPKPALHLVPPEGEVTYVTDEYEAQLRAHFRKMAEEKQYQADAVQRQKLFSTWSHFAQSTSTEAGWNEYESSFVPTEESNKLIKLIFGNA